ncbi:hypothetical protein D3C76_968800 [compost metagenome]
MPKLEGFSLHAKPKREYKPRKRKTTEEKIAKLEAQRAKTGIGTADSYRLTEEQLEWRSNAHWMSLEEQGAYDPSENKLVGSGAWVCVFAHVPVNEDVKPIRWAIYWAVPCKDSKNHDGFDPSGRYKVDVIVKHRQHDAYETVSMFPHEYVIIPQDHLDRELELGHYLLQQLHYSSGEAMDLKLIEEGRALVEEERELIWALQLDGLTETQACNEYFFSRHVNKENHNIWYMPCEAMINELDSIFGE